MTPKQILRILDANFNRSREGLRVCEEITRFVLEDAALTKKLKNIRHGLTACVKAIPVTGLVSARDTASDVGKKPSPLEKNRRDALDVFAANSERVKESLRVLEEVSKLLSGRISDKIKKARFDIYALEKRALPKLEALRDHGSFRSRKNAFRGLR